ncbi:MAG: HupE/UreJ family protein [Chloroflexota bacterium]
MFPITVFSLPTHSDTGYLQLGSFITGLTHPVLGPEHLLAMLSVGIVSARMGGNAIWGVPATFVSVMAMGGVIGLAGFPMPWLEVGIALSVLILGVIIAMGQTLPIVITMITVSVFATFHGYAHGAEMPIMAAPIAYIEGFMTSTVLIHLAGVLLGHLMSHLPTRLSWGKHLARLCGAGITLCGCFFILNLIFSS